MRARRIRRGIAMVVPALLVAGCASLPPPTLNPSPPSVCYDCLWVYQDVAYRDEILEVYGGYASDDPLVRAEVDYLVARMRGDAGALCAAFESFHRRRRSGGAQRRLYAAETLAFTAPECGRDPAPYFELAARLAGRLDHRWKREAYEALAAGTFQPEFAEESIGRSLDVPNGTVGFVLGESLISVENGERIGVQIERTVRDWLSYQMEFDPAARPDAPDELLWYHEGARLRDVLEAARARIVPLPGTIVARRGDAWYAPDENGVFRFQVLPDKMQYPTTRASGDVGLVMDTHGISALVESSVREGVDLVVGCGDHTAKATAAYHLARLGKDVYFPCDRFVGELLGYDARGVLVGSAPVRRDGDRAVIGDTPVRFRADEILVVQDASLRGRFQYYDAPARYFRELSAALPLRIEWVEVDSPGQSDLLVRRALELGAEAIAVRVETEEDYAPVAAWLAGSPARRAVLFHTAPYPAGYRLFAEFPGQTTFGDPRPRFLTGEDG